MKKVLILLFLFLVFVNFAQTPSVILSKAENITNEYKAITGINTSQALVIKNLMIDYLTCKLNGTPISSTVQSQVNNIFTTIRSSSSGSLSATNVLFSYSGNITTSSPLFDRVANTSYDINNLCQNQGTLYTGGNCYYQVIPFSVRTRGQFDFETTSANLINSTFGTDDTYISLYCHFDPLNPQSDLIVSNDDGGAGLLSLISDVRLPVGNYDLVVTTFTSLAYGTYDMEIRSDNGALGTAVPFNYGWIIGLFAMIFIGVIVKRIFF